VKWDALTAIGSIIGGIFTGLAFFATIFLIAREARIRRADKEDEYARQARLIVSRITDEVYPLMQKFRTLELKGTVWNYSDMPIFNLVVRLDAVGAGGEGFRMLHPGSSVDTEMIIRIPDDGKPVDMMLPRKTGLTLHFLDANGRHWVRRGADQPKRVLKDALSEKLPVERYKPEEHPDQTNEPKLPAG
jgi:hypothetical protein